MLNNYAQATTILQKIAEQGDFEYLLSQSEHYLGFAPNNTELMRFKFMALQRLGKAESDIGFLRRYIWYVGLDHQAHLSLAKVYLEQDDKHNALIALAYALSIKPCFQAATQLMADTLQLLGKPRLKIYFLTEERIGHVTTEVDSWLRKQTLSTAEYNCLHLFVSGQQVANPYFDQLLKKHITIVENPFWKQIYCSRPHLLQEEYYGKMPLDLKSCLRVPHTIHQEDTLKNIQDIQLAVPPVIRLSEDEIAHGWQLLAKAGISEKSKVVCYHVRDSAYLEKQQQTKSDVYHDVRDMDIASYEKAVRYLLEHDYVVIRIGSETNQRLDIEHKNYYDFCINRNEQNGDFLEVFLLSVCQFFIGNTSGLLGLANCFDTPILTLNQVPFGLWHPAYCRYASKKYIDREGNIVPFTHMWNKISLIFDGELIENTSGTYPTNILVDNGFSFQDNDEQEILASVIEFAALVENRQLNPKLTKLQQQYLDSIPSSSLCKSSASVLTDAFIRQNIDLFKLSEVTSE